MLQEQSRFVQRLLFVADFLLIVASWLLAYWVRFEVLVPPEYVQLARYITFLPWVLLITSLVFWSSGLYAASRAQSLINMVFAVAKAAVLGALLTMASLFLYRAFSFSRLMFILFALFLPTLMIISRVVVFGAVRRARRKGRNIRRVLIYGAGAVGRRLESAFEKYPWMGFEVLGYVDDDMAAGDRILGTGSDLMGLVDQFESEDRPVDYVYITLPLSAADKIKNTVNQLSTRLVHVLMVPDLIQFDLLNSRVTHLDGLPVIHIIDEAPVEFSQVAKRGLDIVISLLVLIVTLPLFLVLSLIIKLTSPGPVMYRQERMGLNGHKFQILKFRTMPTDAEKLSGPVWASAGDNRSTGIGNLLRRTSLDELPQFVNVLKGDMSVVGPRPERPVFIHQFREHVPFYMLRHKTKAGITGWAQVHGWRGDTSLEKRIEYDLYYIHNWSIGLDIKIMWLTLWRGFGSQNAY